MVLNKSTLTVLANPKPMASWITDIVRKREKRINIVFGELTRQRIPSLFLPVIFGYNQRNVNVPSDSRIVNSHRNSDKNSWEPTVPVQTLGLASERHSRVREEDWWSSGWSEATIELDDDCGKDFLNVRKKPHTVAPTAHPTSFIHPHPELEQWVPLTLYWQNTVIYHFQ